MKKHLPSDFQMKEHAQEFDIVIVGGGLTGLVLVHALAEMGLHIAVVDTKPLLIQTSDADYDLRSLALSYKSQIIFSELGIWDELEKFTLPIKKVHVSDRGHFGFTHIHANDYHLPCLGSVIPLQILQQQLMNKAKRHANISWFLETDIIETVVDNGERKIKLAINKIHKLLSCRLLICADGANSILRKMLNIHSKQIDYQQTAIVATIGVTRSHDNTAYERFTEFGPLALLPVSASAFSLVLTLKPEMAEIVAKLDEKEFLTYLQKAFGYRVGKFDWASARQSFPLFLSQVDSIYTERAVVVGNAAHTLHPIAGQGFNLGLRDVAILVKKIQQQLANVGDVGAKELLSNYELLRVKDHKKTIDLTNSLVNLFSNKFTPLCIIRNLALLGIDHTFMKNRIAKNLMGFVT